MIKQEALASNLACSVNKLFIYICHLLVQYLARTDQIYDLDSRSQMEFIISMQMEFNLINGLLLDPRRKRLTMLKEADAPNASITTILP